MYVCMYVCMCLPQPTSGYFDMKTHQSSGDLSEYGVFLESPQKRPQKWAFTCTIPIFWGLLQSPQKLV